MQINKDSGFVTLIAFDRGLIFEEHTAPFDALVHILDGKAEILIPDEIFVLEKGEMIIMSANKSHAVNAIERFKIWLSMIKS